MQLCMCNQLFMISKKYSNHVNIQMQVLVYVTSVILASLENKHVRGMCGHAEAEFCQTVVSCHKNCDCIAT